MIVKPYKRFHTKKLIAFVTPEGHYIDEHGEQLDPLKVRPVYRCFAAWHTVNTLTANGYGESLLWNGEAIRWRPVQHPDEPDWYARPSDVYVLRIPMHERTEPNVAELCRWRDWLWTYRAIPATMGGTSIGLLKARLRRPLYCSVNWDTNRLRASAGGIIRNGPAGQGEFHGRLIHWDMPAAYATEIGTLRYGGKWWDEENTSDYWLNHLHKKGVPILLRARVRIPTNIEYGPLPIRPRRLKDYHPMKRKVMALSGKLYPIGKTIQGVWTYEEIIAARNVGCSVRILNAWHHSSPPRSPFADWWSAIQEGREMAGLAGMLAKVTGNALWGMFALDPDLRSRRSIIGKSSKAKRMTTRKVQIPSRRPVPAIDLAEIVAGRVRARLYGAMMECGDDMICAHTDGLWTVEGINVGPGWRVKEQARRLQLLSPQHMRWYPSGRARPTTMYSGVPYEDAESNFERDWNELQAQDSTA